MSKSLNISLSEEALSLVKEKMAEVNRDFDGGRVKICDVVNEMILTSKVDVKVLQGKHMNLKRLLRSLSTRNDLDVDAIIRMVSDAKGKGARKKSNGEESV